MQICQYCPLNFQEADISLLINHLKTNMMNMEAQNLSKLMESMCMVCKTFPDVPTKINSINHLCGIPISIVN